MNTLRTLRSADPGAAGRGRGGRATFARGVKLVLLAGLIAVLASGCPGRKARNDAITFLKDFNAQCQLMNKEVVIIPIPSGNTTAVATTDTFWKEVDGLDEIWKRHPDLKDKEKYGKDIAPALAICEELYQEIKSAQAAYLTKKGGGKNKWRDLMVKLNQEMEKDVFKK